MLLWTQQRQNHITATHIQRVQLQTTWARHPSSVGNVRSPALLRASTKVLSYSLNYNLHHFMPDQTLKCFCKWAHTCLTLLYLILHLYSEHRAPVGVTEKSAGCGAFSYWAPFL